MNMYIMVPWIEYRTNLGFFNIESFLNSYEFSEELKNKFIVFEHDPFAIELADLEKIINELKSKLSISSDVFEEIEIYIKLSKKPIDPYMEFSHPDYVILKKENEWELYHISSRTKASTVNTKGTGFLSDSIKLSYITNPSFQGQGLTTEFVKMFIDSLSGTIEINAINPQSKSIALKLGFSLNQETNTFVLKI